MTLLLEITEYGDAARWHWRLTEEGGAFIADHPVALDTGAVEYQGFVDLHGSLQHRADPGRPRPRLGTILRRLLGPLSRDHLPTARPALSPASQAPASALRGRRCLPTRSGQALLSGG